ncbi:MAG TPA: nitrite transporter NirC [Stellaceae bacterium]|nr:nitrite transporter NirC [Stellaceae bacterium]
MFLETVDQFAASAVAKSAFLKRSPLGFWISAMMAGAYVGLGIILIFSIGSDADPAYRGLIMGASFGIALTLVILAGSELFTGHTMVMSLGVLRGKVTLGELGACWTMSWLGNLAGCAVLALLFVAGGGGAMLHSKSNFIMAVATAKMTAPAVSLFARAVLCNWLVCLAIWMAGRTQSDAAKCIAIFWCLFGFIGSGYEHSIANMTLLLIALFSSHPDTVTWGGFAYNMIWVTLGNAVAGSVFMATAYWAASRPLAVRASAFTAMGDAAE